MENLPTPYAANANASDKVDYSEADSQQSFEMIPKGTVAKVRMTVKPGGYNDPSRRWTGGYATFNTVSGAVYLNCEFVILDGKYVRRKIWGRIGLHSPRGPEWNRMGNAFIKGIASSARGIAENDKSPEARAAQTLGFAELDGIEFTAFIDVEENKKTGKEHNVIKRAILKGQKGYTMEEREAMGREYEAAEVADPSSHPWGR